MNPVFRNAVSKVVTRCQPESLLHHVNKIPVKTLDDQVNVVDAVKSFKSCV